MGKGYKGLNTTLLQQIESQSFGVSSEQQEKSKEMSGPLCLLRNNDLFLLRLGLVLACPRMLPSPFLLDSPCFQHGAFELGGRVDRFG